MSLGVAEVVREFGELCLIRRDLEAGLRLVDAHATFDWSNSRAPYGGVFRGHAQIADACRNLWEVWDEFAPEITEAIEIDPETAVLVTRARARGKGSGIAVQARGASVWTVRDGKIVQGRLFQSKAEALEAVGLSE